MLVFIQLENESKFCVDTELDEKEYTQVLDHCELSVTIKEDRIYIKQEMYNKEKQ